MTLKRIQWELKEAEDYPTEGVSIFSQSADKLELKALIVGQEGSIY